MRNAPFIAVELDAALRVTVWNEAAARTFGVPAEAAIGAEIKGLLGASSEGFWGALVEGGAPRTTTHVRPDGRRVVCEWTCHPERDAEGRRVAAGCYGRDVTGEVADTAASRLERAMLRAIVENVNIIVWAMEPNGNCTYHQGRALASINLPQHALVGQNLREIYANLDPEPLDRACAGEVQHSISEVEGQCFENWMIPARDADGKVELVVALSLNVSELRESERRLREKLLQIEAQREVIRALSSPIIEVWDKVLTVPIIGAIDSSRAAELMDNLLQAVTRSRARYAILDLTGVEEVDSDTAAHLLGLVRAVRLLGAESVITGIHPRIAQTIVDLELETRGLTVLASLREALGHCITAMARARG